MQSTSFEDLDKSIQAIIDHGKKLKEENSDEKGQALCDLAEELRIELNKYQGTFCTESDKNLLLNAFDIAIAKKLHLIKQHRNMASEIGSFISKPLFKFATVTGLSIPFKPFITHSEILIESVIEKAKQIVFITKLSSEIPNELIEHISSFLPLDSASAYARTNKNNYEVVKSSLFAIKNSEEYKQLKLNVEKCILAIRTLSMLSFLPEKTANDECTTLKQLEPIIAKFAHLIQAKDIMMLALYYGQFDLHNESIKKALFWTRTAADKGHEHAIFHLAIFYNESKMGLEKSVDKAAECLEKIVNTEDKELSEAVNYYLKQFGNKELADLLEERSANNTQQLGLVRR